ncbi:Gfo/Idh/MocA family protein [Novosphingobium barchaimii]|nr:Gfo/Idh/MocA family oxidoreductase [Novosphingobium barchaimii]
MRPLRLAIAGANPERGWARDTHIPALAGIPAIELVAVSARNQDIADAAAEAFGASRAYGDTLSMVRDPDVDVVAVTVKVPEHRAIVLAALEAGKHVYCEWPLGRNLAEAREMADAARRSGLHVAVGLQGANSVAVRHAAALVRDGAVGRPLALRVVSSTAGWGTTAPPHYAYLQDRSNGATLGTIAGGHTLAAAEAVVGACVEISARNSILLDTVEIAGTGERVRRSCADHMLLTAKHESGCVSSIEIVGGQPIPLRFELRGVDGTLEIQGYHPGGYQCAELQVVCSKTAQDQPLPAVGGLDGAAINVAQLWSQFENDIRDGTRTVPDFDKAVRLTRLLDAIETASDEGRTVALAD